MNHRNRQRRWGLALSLLPLALLLPLSCATAPASVAPASPPALGYTIAQDVVEFRFAPWDFNWVTNGKTGQWFALEKFPRIDTVAVAGPFNQWRPDATPMTRQEDGFYTVRMATTDLVALGPKMPFKFVINGVWWVEPPVKARNSVDTNFMNKSSNLILELPGGKP